MNPVFIIAIPLALVILGMILNSWDLGFNQPQSSTEQDAVKRLTAEKESYRKFFDAQRSRSMKRQKRVGQYGWLVMASFIGAFIWLYADTVSKTSLSSRVAGLQTLATEEGKQMVLSVTLSDGNNVKYLIKLPQADKLVAAKEAPANEKVSSWEIERLGTALSTGDKLIAAKEAPANEKVSSWEIERLGTALSTGDNPLPLGVALKISQLASEPR